ncbi:MAG: LPS assembly lipoprotein LptE [Pseudomonadota bacterium]
MQVAGGTLTLAAISGCGFSLRAASSLPASLKVMHIVAEPRSRALVREFERQLDIAGGRRSASSGDATATLRILEDDSGERVLSLATTGGPEELEAYHIVRFELWRDDDRIYGPDSLTLRRDYTFDKNDVLGKRREFETLQTSLRQNIVTRMLRRLSLAPETQ